MRQAPSALLYEFAFAGTIVTKYQKLSGLNHIHFWSHGSGVSKFKLKLSAGACGGKELPKGSPLACGRALFYLCLFTLSFFHARLTPNCPFLSSHTGLGSSGTSFELDFLSKDPTSKEAHILTVTRGFWGHPSTNNTWFFSFKHY